MVKRTKMFFLVLLLALLLVACGGSDTGETAATNQPTDDTAATDQATDDTVTRVKEHSSLGSAPGPIEASAAEGPADRGAAALQTSDVAGVCLSAAEGDLARMVNEYRASLDLPALQISKSLSLVAQQHAWDSINNQNSWPAPPAGKTCNSHSWSSVVNPALQQGTWTANCYTSDHANAQGMWNKPGEIAGFPGEGVENSFASGGTATASGALTAWKNSPGHNNVITQQGGWGPMSSMGVGMSGGVAHLWLSGVTDPAGEALLCSGGSAMAPQPTAVPPTEVPPTDVPPTDVPPTDVPPTDVPPTVVPPTVVPSTDVPSTVAATAAPTEAPTEVPPTEAPTEVPPTEAPTEVPPTEAPTEVPATEAPTEVPPTEAPTAAPSGTILDQNGTIAAGESEEHVFDVSQGRTYTVLVTPSAEFDVDPTFNCSLSGGEGASGSFDWHWEGEAESFTYDPPAGNGTCRITVGGYEGSTGTYTIKVTAQ